MFHKTKNNLYTLLSVFVLLMPFSVLAGGIEFSNQSNFSKSDRYIVVIGSKPTNARNSLAKQINFDSIYSRDDAKKILSKSEGVYINVGELMQDDDGKLFEELYQAYEMGAILFFEAEDQQQINFRNSFLKDNFSELESEKRYLAVYKSNSLSPKKSIDMFFKSIEYHPNHSLNQLSTNSAAANAGNPCPKLLLASAIVNVFTASGYLSSSSATSSNESASSSSSLLVALAGVDLVNSVFNLGRIIGCSRAAEKMISEKELISIVNNELDKRTLDTIIQKLDVLRVNLAKNRSDLYGTGSNPTLYKQKTWITDRLSEIDQIHPLIRSLGHKATKVAGALAVEELGLLKTYYKIYEKQSDQEKKRAITYLIGNNTEPARFSILNKTFQMVSESNRNFVNSFKNYVTTTSEGQCVDPDCTQVYLLSKASWGICSGRKNDQGPYCEVAERVSYGNDAQDSKNRAWNAGVAALRIMKKRYVLPSAYRAAQEYKDYFQEQLKRLRYKYNKDLESLISGYYGFSLDNHVILYGEGEQNGYEIVLDSNKNYSLWDLKFLGMKDNDISSIDAPEYMTATLYDGNRFDGWNLVLKGNPTLWSPYDNAMSSIKIGGKHISLPRSGLFPNENFTVNYTGAPGNAKDWIGIYKQGAPNEGFITWQYTQGKKSGSLTFAGLGLYHGDYSARLFLNDSYKLLKKTTFKVDAKMSTTKIKYEISEDITVRFRDAPGNAKDWIGLYKKGAPSNPNHPSIAWKYINGKKSGSVTFTKNLDPGEYTVRLYHNDSYMLVNSFGFSVN